MRKHYMDNIRWFTVILVLVYHVFYLFNHVGVLGNVKPLEGMKYADVLLYFVYPWFMVLLFVVSGMSTRFALLKRNGKQFLSERAKKLIVPSTLGLFVFQWIGGYFNVKLGGALDTMTTVPGPVKYLIFVVSGTGPLWFIQTLFLFSLLILLIRKLDRNDRLWSACGKANLLILLLLAIPIWGASHILNIPVISVYRFGIYFVAYLLGYFVFSHDEVIDRLEKVRIPLLILALIMGCAYTAYYFGSDYTSTACLQSLFTNAYLWIMILAILACAKAWFNKTSAFTTYMSQISFGWYILHYPVLLTISYVLVFKFSLPSLAVYLLALFIEFIGTALLYEIIKRIPVVRFLVLGIKANK